MAIRSRTYYWLVCTGRIDNIVGGECGARSPGGWDGQEEVEAEALTRGWVKSGKGHTCPSCAAAAGQTEEAPKPARRVKAAPPVEQPIGQSA